MNTVDSSNAIMKRLAVFLPIAGWLPLYRADSLGKDFIAGLTLAAYSLPVAMAYSTLAGLPPQTGLYSYITGGLVYSLFATSRHLAVGPTAAISVMTASVIGGMAGTDVGQYAVMASMTAGMVAVFCFIAWIMRLSTFVNFISETILLGFKAGAALSIASTQLYKFLGVPAGGNNFFERLYSVVQQAGDTNTTVLILGIASLLFLSSARRYFPAQPAALVVVVLGTVAVSIFGLDANGVKVLGIIPSGFPSFSLPVMELSRFESLLELAFACFLLSYVESIAAARSFAEKYSYQVDPHQELLGLGAANLAASFWQGYPVAGGLSQSAVNEKAGAHSPLSLVFASLSLVLALFFLTGWLRNIPDVVLAAIVLVAVSGFVKISDFKYLWQISRLEFNVALVAFVGVLLFGILKGVAISAIASILFLLRLMAKPHVAVLGRIPGTTRFSDAVRHPGNEQYPGLFLFRVEAPLLYFNVENICISLSEQMKKEITPVSMVICDLSTSPYIDAAGARMLAKMEEQFEEKGISFHVCEAHAEVREILRATGISERLGGVSRYSSISDMVEDFERDVGRV